MIDSAFFTAVGLCWLLCRFDIKKVAGYAAATDLFITAGLTVLFIGTYAGMVTGMFAGLFVSIFLTLIRRVAGYKRLQFIRLEGEYVAHLRWVHHTPA